jgi:sialate O-acetylesterase
MKALKHVTVAFMVICNFFCTGIKAQIILPSIFGDNMVLQQKSDAAIWGWGDPGTEIRLTTSWDTTTYKAICQNSAKWGMNIKTPGAGGPYTIQIKGSNEITLKNIMIGEVWICSGQSNMEWSAAQGFDNSENEVKNANYPFIRLFHVKKTSSESRQENCFGKWSVCTPESMKSFSAIAYCFGKLLYDSLKIPVGLINASWGGTPAEVWVRKDHITSDPLLWSNAPKQNVAQWWTSAPGEAYNTMISPLIPYDIAGCIWYQGESNVATANGYKRLFTTLIQTWRNEFGKQFPFYFVQIAPHEYSKPTGRASAFLREAQTQTLDVPGTGMIVITDLVDNVKNIHPRNKPDVGKRLAYLALSGTYGITGITYKYPMYKSMKIEKEKIRIIFTHSEKGLISKNGEPTCFEIAGDDQRFVPAHAKIEKGTVVVWANHIKKPVAVRFSFTNAAISNLFSKEGLPVCPFRTDNWEN